MKMVFWKIGVWVAVAGSLLWLWQQSIVNALSPHGSPILFGTFLGGELSDYAYEIVTDGNGQVYVAGTTSSPIFPAPNYDQHGVDVFYGALAADGASMDYIVHVNPTALNQVDDGYGIAIDSNGNIYVTGQAQSDDFPTTSGAYDESYNGNGDAFLMKIDPAGNLLFSTFLGGSDVDTARDVIVDNNDNPYVVGSSWSTDFIPTTIGPLGQRDIFALRVSQDGSAVAEAVLIGGAGQEEARFAVWQGESLLITGWTRSTNFPTTASAYDQTHNGGADVFGLKLDLEMPALLYSSYLGGASDDFGYGLVMDSAGNAHFTGSTSSTNFPTTANSWDNTLNDGINNIDSDAFWAKLSANGNSLLYATYLGGTVREVGAAIGYDPGQGVFFTGLTESTNFPTSDNAYDNSLDGGQDGFIAQFSPNGQLLEYGSFLGGSDWEEGSSLVVGADGMLYVAGKSQSPDFPVTNGAYDTTHNGEMDAFILKINLTGSPNPTPTPSPIATATATATSTPQPTFTPTVGVSVTPTTNPSPTPTPTHTATPTAIIPSESWNIYLPALLR